MNFARCVFVFASLWIVATAQATPPWASATGQGRGASASASAGSRGGCYRFESSATGSSDSRATAHVPNGRAAAVAGPVAGGFASRAIAVGRDPYALLRLVQLARRGGKAVPGQRQRREREDEIEEGDGTEGGLVDGGE